MREVELKYTVQDQRLWQALQHQDLLLDGYSLGPARRQETVDVYWDTADYALIRGGFGLRTRCYQSPGSKRSPVEWQVTLKEMKGDPETALANRVEVEALLTAKELDALDRQPDLKLFQRALAQQGWPLSAKQQVIFHQAAPKLYPIAVLLQKREKRMLCQQKGEATEPVGEMSLDDVRVYAPPPEPSHVSRWALRPEKALQPIGDFHELEIEAASEEQYQHYLALAKELAKVYSLAPSPAGKAERALKLVAQFTAEGTLGIQPAMSMNCALRSIWRQQLHQLLVNESKVRHRQDEEAVHDMRVAIRRMRAAERIFKKYVDKRGMRPVLKMLQATALILGEARDLDVSLALLQSYQSASDAQADARVEELAGKWQAQRQEAYIKVQRWLEGKAYSTLIRDLAIFCNTQQAEDCLPGNGDEGAPVPYQVRHHFPSEILKRYATVRAYESVMQKDTPLEAYHALRIEAKKLRYAIEFVRHLLEPEATPRLIKKLKAVQDCLGNLNDVDTMQKRLTSSQAAPPAIVAHLDQVISTEKRNFARLWSGFVHVETRRQLTLAIAHL
jgi:triphosphatase